MAKSQSRKRPYNFRQKRNQLLFNLGMGKSLHRNRSGRRILAYQGVDQNGGYGINQRFTAVGQLDLQLTYFKENFHVISLSEYFAGENDPDRLTIALTFDGGYRSHYDLVLPLLEKHELPATFFVTAAKALGMERIWTDTLDLARLESNAPLKVGAEKFFAQQGAHWQNEEGKSLPEICRQSDYSFVAATLDALPYTLRWMSDEKHRPHWELLSEDQLKALANHPLISLGTHGLLHTDFSEIDRWFAYEEMKQSKEWLEHVTGQEVSALSYPFGGFTEMTTTDALDLGYQEIVANYANPSKASQSSLPLPRFAMEPDLKWNHQLADLLKGKH